MPSLHLLSINALLMHFVQNLKQHSTFLKYSKEQCDEDRKEDRGDAGGGPTLVLLTLGSCQTVTGQGQTRGSGAAGPGEAGTGGGVGRRQGEGGCGCIWSQVVVVAVVIVVVVVVAIVIVVDAVVIVVIDVRSSGCA